MTKYSLIGKEFSRLITFLAVIVAWVFFRAENKEQYQYLDILKESLEKNKVVFYDFHNPTSIHSTLTEFVDGIHGGDVVYARILNTIGENNKYLKQYLNQKYIDKILRSCKGLPCIPAGMRKGADNRVIGKQ